MRKFHQQGTDITEAFESHHIGNVAEKLLPIYFIRDASQPRNYRFTFKDDGFYKTLKRRAAIKIATLDKNSTWKSKIVLDFALISTFLMAVLTIRSESLSMRIFFGLLTAQFMAWVNTISHNFIHQRNNWRMYAQCLTGTGWRDWRVFHALVS